MDKEIYEQVRKHIREGWELCVVHQEKDGENHEVGVPKPFTAPCIRGIFRILFYWDIYFTNKGLLADGKYQLARNNLEDLCYLVDRYGYIPNMTEDTCVNRSQPPLFAAALQDYVEATGDVAMITEAYPRLQKEYAFWTSDERVTDTGLSRYGNMATPEELYDFYQYIKTRLKLPVETLSREEEIQRGSNYLTEAETGWDFTPRFDNRCEDFAPVDLNSILYVTEQTLSAFARQLGREEEALRYNQLAERRRMQLQQYCRDPETGVYYDYDVARGKRADILTAAAFYPYWAGIETQTQGIPVLLGALEFSHGISTCEKRPSDRVYQWDYPNMWPPLIHICVLALLRVHLYADAQRIGQKYLDTVCEVFAQTGALWEKYDVNTGGIAAHNEYEMTELLDWSAGAFCDIADRLASIDEKKI